MHTINLAHAVTKEDISRRYVDQYAELYLALTIQVNYRSRDNLVDDTAAAEHPQETWDYSQ